MRRKSMMMVTALTMFSAVCLAQSAIAQGSFDETDYHRQVIALYQKYHQVEAVDTVSNKECTRQLNVGERNLVSDNQMAWDTLTYMIETCTSYPDAGLAFNDLLNAFESLHHVTERPLFRQYVSSVLYINPYPQYFCLGVESIAMSWNSVQEANNTIAVLRWLGQNDSACHKQFQHDVDSMLRFDQVKMWRAGDTTKPIDTALPSMHDLGLDTVLEKHLGVNIDRFASIVPSYGLTKNPTDGQTELRFTLGSEAYVRVQVCDILGRAVAGDETGRILSLGEHRLPLDLSLDPAGTYYLRISLGTGEARTIKIVKE